MKQYTPVEGIEAWEQQPKESAAQFEMFRILRDMGPRRSLRRLHNTLVEHQIPATYGSICVAAAEFCWIARSRLWDLEVDRQAREAAIAEATERATRQIKLTDAMLTIAGRGVMVYDALLSNWKEDRAKALAEGAPAPPPPISIDEITKLTEVSVRMSQLAQGKPTEIQDTTTRQGLTPEFAMFARRQILGVGDSTPPSTVIIDAQLEDPDDKGNGHG